MRESGSAGCVSANGGAAMIWLCAYALAGVWIGAAFGHPGWGLVAGLVLGFYPSMAIGVAAHYGEFMWLLAPAFIVAGFLAPAYRVWMSGAFAILPWLLVLGLVVMDAMEGRAQKLMARNYPTMTVDELLAAKSHARDDELRARIVERLLDPALLESALDGLLKFFPGGLDLPERITLISRTASLPAAAALPALKYMAEWEYAPEGKAALQETLRARPEPEAREILALLEPKQQS